MALIPSRWCVRSTESELDSERIDIAIDPFTGRNPSYCFVDLLTKEQAERAIAELDGRDILGRPVKIKPGVAKSGERMSGGDQSRPSFGLGLDRWRRQDNLGFAKVNSDSSRRVYVGGLPRLTEHEALQGNIHTFFQGYSMYVLLLLLLFSSFFLFRWPDTGTHQHVSSENVSKLFTPHPGKRFEPGDHYYLFVDLSTVEEAQRAMDTLNGQPGPWGGALRVQRARGTNHSEERKEGSNQDAQI